MRTLTPEHRAKISRGVRKLSDEQVRKARRLLEEHSAREVALMLRVSEDTLYLIKSKKAYGDVPDEPPETFEEKQT